jgi:transposase
MPGSTGIRQQGWQGCWCDRVVAASQLFSPVHPTAAAAQEARQHLCQRDPRTGGVTRSRWTLATLRGTCQWLGGLTLSGVHQVLQRLKLVWKRPRVAIRSPDPDYDAKRADVAAAVAQARTHPSRIVAVYLDEMTITRQSTLAPAYAPQGHAQARALYSHRANTETRVVAALDALTGRVRFQRAAKITVAVLVQFYQALVAAYPEAERLYVIQDTWPVHTHPDVLVALTAQQTRWPGYRPPNGPAAPSARARKKWGHLHLPIQMVPLPTYASWCNPIEKLWRKLRQAVTHLHRWADDLTALRTQVDHFLEQFAHGSADLLRYVGLKVPD